MKKEYMHITLYHGHTFKQMFKHSVKTAIFGRVYNGITYSLTALVTTKTFDNVLL